MASAQAKANMDYDARNRLAVVTQTLIERFGIDPVAPRNAHRDQDLRRVYEVEDFATILERLEVATRKPEPIMTAPEPIMTAPEPIMTAPEPIMTAPEPIKTLPSTRKRGK